MCAHFSVADTMNQNRLAVDTPLGRCLGNADALAVITSTPAALSAPQFRRRHVTTKTATGERPRPHQI